MERHLIVMSIILCLIVVSTLSDDNITPKTVKTNLEKSEKEIESHFLMDENYKTDGTENGEESQTKKRIKRAKYYYPTKFYKLPPMVHQIKGPFSVTPPPNLRQREYVNGKPNRNKKPINDDGMDGLANEDLINIVKYLSKKDKDKLRQFIDDKSGYGSDVRYLNKRESYKEIGLYNDKDKGWIESDGFGYARDFPQTKPYSNEPKIHYSSQNFANSLSKQNREQNKSEMDFLNANIFNEINNIADQIHQVNKPGTNYVGFGINNSGTNNVGANNVGLYYPGTNNIGPNNYEENDHFKNNIPLIETQNNFENKHISYDGEILPKPENLREDYEASFTHNIAKVVKPEYDLRNFGELPLMNTRDSKLDSVSSYYVPHYTITSSSKHHQSSKPSKIPAVELAQSKKPEPGEAHLKAIKIWTHQSQGVAYTLHDDGTLSLEKKT